MLCERCRRCNNSSGNGGNKTSVADCNSWSSHRHPTGSNKQLAPPIFLLSVCVVSSPETWYVLCGGLVSFVSCLQCIGRFLAQDLVCLVKAASRYGKLRVDRHSIPISFDTHINTQQLVLNEATCLESICAPFERGNGMAQAPRTQVCMGVGVFSSMHGCCLSRKLVG